MIYYLDDVWSRGRETTGLVTTCCLVSGTITLVFLLILASKLAQDDDDDEDDVETSTRYSEECERFLHEMPSRVYTVVGAEVAPKWLPGFLGWVLA